MICKLCHKPFWVVTNTHLSSRHGISISDYNRRFGAALSGIAVQVGTLPKSDPRYRRWRKSLKRRPPPWSKGYTKYTHPSIAKISRTFKRKGIDNFARWRREMEAQGRFYHSYPDLPQTGDLAELIGVVLGDGHVEKFPRTEALTIAGNSKNVGFIKRYARFVKVVFGKQPYIGGSQKFKNCTRIRIYQKDISRRLGIPTGSRGKLRVEAPHWIWQNPEFLIRFLRGLYEAEGSFCVHRSTSTHKLLFSNRNSSLLGIVYRGLQVLGFHPHRSRDKIQLSRREEVYRCKTLLRFRQY